MKRRWLFLLAICLSGAVPLSAWADVDLITTANGTNFKVGMREKMVAFTLQNLDLVDNFDFTSFISPDRQLGEQDWGIQNFANLTFTLEKGPLRIHANLEMEAGLDAASVDVNNVNLERMALYYKIPTLGTLAAGFDVHAIDPEGGLIYTDEHPGLWLVGGNEGVSWDVAWHLVLNCNRGGTLFSGLGTTGPCTRQTGVPPADDFGQQSNIFSGRVNINVADGTTVSPMIVYYRRHVPQAGLNEFSAPALVAGAVTATPNRDTDAESDQFRPGAVVKTKVGPATVTFEGVGLFGEIKDVDTRFLGGDAATAALTTEDYDLRSFALFFEVALDGDAIGMPGWTPYVNFEWHSGDDDPFDDTYEGYVPISNLSGALRKDGFKGQSISTHGPSVLGAGSEDGWGFDVISRGQGPTLGGILPDETLGGDGTTFNNRGGKAGNPGFFKASAGVLGKIDANWDTHFGISAFWYDATEAIEAEAAQNCIARASSPFGCAGSATSDANVRTAITTLSNNGVDLDQHFMGVEINGNVGYNVNNFRIQPFFSVFIPGDIVDNINDAFLSTSLTGAGRADDSETGFTAGVEFSAAF